MSFPDVINLCSDDEAGEADVKVVKQEPDLDQNTIQQTEQYNAKQVPKQTSKTHSINLESQENGSLNSLKTVRSRLGEASFAVNGSSFASRLPPAPVCRQFWKAGSYDDAQASKVLLQGRDFVVWTLARVEVSALRWDPSAIAELLDNAFDEIQNGATYVMVDRTSNPRDGSPALLIQDDGGGMDPESMRHCMSFGFSDKKSKSAIGQYGNGFKTSTMRLGADVIVFSRHMNKRTLTQSVGLLSYTFLRETGHDRIVVPVVDYEFDLSTGKFRASCGYSAEHFSSNLSMLLKWSPYAADSELLNQFDDIGHHGTKVIIYNLWFIDDGNLELDFESDAEDILIGGAPKVIQTQNFPKMINQQHIANRLNYSLRVYLSILYLRIPKNFRIILRGRVVEHHNIANDLKFPEFILYKPHVGGNSEVAVITTIGFLKDAPRVNIHGFSVYHKNRLIMPFWRVVSQSNSRGRGVAGVLEANFVEPTHNKQDFEKTTLFQKLEARLKEMTLEYWDYHCGLIGYQQVKKASAASGTPHSKAQSSLQPVTINPSSVIKSPRVASVSGSCQNVTVASSILSGEIAGKSAGHYQIRSQPGLPMKRKRRDLSGNAIAESELLKRAGLGANSIDSRHKEKTQSPDGTANLSQDQEATSLKQENKKLRALCSDYEKKEEELNDRVEQLRIELLEVEHEYARLLAESKLLEPIKDEKT